MKRLSIALASLIMLPLLFACSGDLALDELYEPGVSSADRIIDPDIPLIPPLPGNDLPLAGVVGYHEQGVGVHLYWEVSLESMPRYPDLAGYVVEGAKGTYPSQPTSWTQLYELKVTGTDRQRCSGSWTDPISRSYNYIYSVRPYLNQNGTRVYGHRSYYYYTYSAPGGGGDLGAGEEGPTFPIRP